MASFHLSESAIARLEAELRKNEQQARADRLVRNQGGYEDPATSSQKFEVFEQAPPSAPVARRGHNLRRPLYALIACVIAMPIAYKFLVREMLQGSAAVRASEPVLAISNDAGLLLPPASESKQVGGISAASLVTTPSEPTVSAGSEIPSQMATLSQGTRSSKSETPPTAAASAPAPQEQSTTSAGRKLGLEEIKLLMDRGKRFAADGDLTSARLFFQRAAEAGDATAALALGATYDPAIIGKLSLVGVLGDVNKSKVWYEKAAALGSSEAARRLGRAADQ